MSNWGRTIPALAATAVALTLASCGGDAGGGDTTTTSAADRDAARIRFEQCLRRNGVEVGPSTSQGGGGGPSTSIEGDGDKLREASEKCAKYREDAFGELTEEQRQEFRDAFAKFSSCMRKQGVELPAPPAAGGASGGGGEVRRQRLEASPKMREAMEACREELPQADQGGGGVLIGPGPGAGR